MGSLTIPPDDDPALVRYVAREIAAGSKPRVLSQELQRDYAYTPARASQLIANARLALRESPSIRGDEEIVADLEARARGSLGKAKTGLIALVVAVLIGIAVYLASGKLVFPGWLVLGLIVVGLAGAVTWWRTQRLLRIHRARRGQR